MGYIYGVKYIGDTSSLSERSRNNLCRRYCYIGQAVDYQRRWNQEKAEARKIEGGEQSKFYDTLRSFRIENFVWEIILIVPDEDMDIIEDEYIVKYSLSPNGLNLRRGGKRGEITQELRDTLSRVHKKRFESLEARQKNQAAQKLAYSDPALRALQRNIRLAWLETEAGIQNSKNHSEFMRNRPAEMIQKQADSLRAHYQTEEGKAQAASHAISHSATMKQSPKCQAHMKRLNETLAQRRKENPVVHRCDVCNYQSPKNSKPKLRRHMGSKRHIEAVKALTPAQTAPLYML
jgi:rubrerythrin